MGGEEMNLQEATESQQKAITSEAKVILCAAGPGSGKSSTIVSRIERLLAQGVAPEKIGAISFTNAAANELKRRLPSKDGTTPVAIGFCGTLHSFALRMLKRHGAPFGYGEQTAIIAPDSAEDLMTAKAAQLSCKTAIKDLLKEKAEKGRPARGERLTLDQTVIATYLDELKEAGIVDYDVLLQEFRAMLTQDTPAALSAVQSMDGEFEYLFVDEVQDSARIDWEIFRALPIANKFYSGDGDQAIYSFRGGTMREMLREASNICTTTIWLQENFRSWQAICTAANNLIRHNIHRIPKMTTPAATGGFTGTVTNMGEFADESEEVSAIADQIGTDISGQQIAVICRTNAIVNTFRDGLKSRGVPVVGVKYWQTPPDWRLARAIVEFLGAPANDSLAYFLLIQERLDAGKTPARAREEATSIRIEANSAGKSINEHYLNYGKIERPESLLMVLKQRVSIESHMLAVQKWMEMGQDGTVSDLAIAMAGESNSVKEAEEEGVHILTVHGAKGREFDTVFMPAFEDQCYPGQSGKTADGVEEERRIAFVGITRARHALYFSSAKNRKTPWKAVDPRKPSRFLKEIFP